MEHFTAVWTAGRQRERGWRKRKRERECERECERDGNTLFIFREEDLYSVKKRKPGDRMSVGDVRACVNLNQATVSGCTTCHSSLLSFEETS